MFLSSRTTTGVNGTSCLIAVTVEVEKAGRGQWAVSRTFGHVEYLPGCPRNCRKYSRPRLEITPIAGFSRSNRSNKSCWHRLAQGANENLESSGSAETRLINVLGTQSAITRQPESP